MWTNRSDATYPIGEELTLFVRTSHDAAVTVLNVDAAGRTTRLFPNKFAPDNRLRANQVYQLPGADASFKLRVGGPTGVNLIKVIATTGSGPIFQGHPTRSDEPFESYEDKSEELAQQIDVVMKQQPRSVWAMMDRPIRVVSQPVAVLPPQVIVVPGPGPGGSGGPLPPPVSGTPPVMIVPPFGLGKVPSAFGLDLRTTKTTYRVGEELALTVTPERNCKLTLVSVDRAEQRYGPLSEPVESEPALGAGRTAFLPGTVPRCGSRSWAGRACKRSLRCVGESWVASLFHSDTDRAVFPSVGNETNATQLIAARAPIRAQVRACDDHVRAHTMIGERR